MGRRRMAVQTKSGSAVVPRRVAELHAAIERAGRRRVWGVSRPGAISLQASGCGLPAALGVVLVDGRQRREVALDRTRELLGVRRDDLQLLLAARPVALTACVLAKTARHTRPFRGKYERRSSNEQGNREHTHEPKDSRERRRLPPPGLAHSKTCCGDSESSR